MKTHKFEINNRDLLIWFIVFVGVYLMLSMWFHDFDKFWNIALYGLIPGWFTLFHGKIIEDKPTE